MSKAGCPVLTVSVWVCDQPWHCAQLPELLWIPPGNSPTLSLSPTLCLSFCLSYTASLYIPPGIGFGHHRHFFPSSFPLCLATCTSQRHARAPLKGWLFFFFKLQLSCCPIWDEDILFPWTNSPNQTPYCLLHFCEMVVTHVCLHGEDRSDWLARAWPTCLFLVLRHVFVALIWLKDTTLVLHLCICGHYNFSLCQPGTLWEIGIVNSYNANWFSGLYKLAVFPISSKSVDFTMFSWLEKIDFLIPGIGIYSTSVTMGLLLLLYLYRTVFG